MGILNRSGDPALFEFTHGMDLDAHFYVQEIATQQAWVRALQRIRVLTDAEATSLRTELQTISRLIAQGEFSWREEDEDIHMNIERHLTQALGDVAKKIHFGRSRNDLIATSLRLYVSESIRAVEKKVRDLTLALIEQAESSLDVVIPGMTHLQHAQPLRWSHILASHGFALARDLQRLCHARTFALAYLPLGSAALSGTTLPIDLDTLASELGFSAVSLNSYDAVGDRDFMLDALDAFSTLAVHLSRLSEDISYWASTPVGLVRLAPEWSTGSSIMPNKRNPDVAELTRAKCAQIIADGQAGKILLKGLPSSYASDLHELKRVYMHSLEQLTACLRVQAPWVRGLKIVPERAEALLQTGHILATEYANHLTASGMPFREAYSQIAEWVVEAERSQVSLEQIVARHKAHLPRITFAEVVESRNNVGGTAKSRICEALAHLRGKLEAL